VRIKIAVVEPGSKNSLNLTLPLFIFSYKKLFYYYLNLIPELFNFYKVLEHFAGQINSKYELLPTCTGKTINLKGYNSS
jgi:hypothetical protein